MTIFKERLKNKKYVAWLTLFIVSSIGIILMITSTFTNWEHYTSIDDKRLMREHWKTSIIIWCYFTFQSNLIAVIASAIVIFKGVELSSTHMQRFKTMMAVNLLITCGIFWSLLVSELSEYNPLGLTSTIMVHAITPMLAIFTYFFDGYKNKIEKKSTPLMSFLLIPIYPLTWLILGIIIYYSLGRNGSSAIYTFMFFDKNWVMSVAVISGITIAYPSFVFLFQWIYNK